MKRFIALSALLALVVGLQGCIKLNGSSVVKNDASGTMNFQVSVRSDTISEIKEQAASFGVESDEMDTAFKEMEAFLDEKKLAEEFKKSGLTVDSATSKEKDGWKTIDIKASFKDINAWIVKSRAASKAKLEESGLGEMGDLPFDQLSGMGTPNFFKTDKPGVGQCVLIPSIKDLFSSMDMNPLEALEELGEEELEQIETALDMIGGMFHLNEMNLAMSLKLPGKVLSTTGCKKSGENGIAFSMKGSEITVDRLQSMFGFMNGVSCTFEIPEGCKIKFEDKKSSGSKAKSSDQAEEKKTEKKGEKKGALKIGGGKNG